MDPTRRVEHISDQPPPRIRVTLPGDAPARLLGIAQCSIEEALRMNDLASIKTKLAADLARITPPEMTA